MLELLANTEVLMVDISAVRVGRINYAIASESTGFRRIVLFDRSAGPVFILLKIHRTMIWCHRLQRDSDFAVLPRGTDVGASL